MNKPRPGILPTKKHRPKTRMSEYSHGIYAQPGFGKTTFGNGWRKAIFAGCEPGTAAMEAADVPVRSWEDFVVFLDAIENERHDFETVIVDTVDMLHHYCRASVCAELGIAHPADGNYAKGWDLLKDRWIGGISRASRLTRGDGKPMCTLFIGHEKITPLTERKGGQIVDTGRSLITTNLATSARGILHSCLDFLYHGEFAEEDLPTLGISKGDRLIRTQPADLPHARIEAKGRGTLDRMLPEPLPLDFSALFGAFNSTFNGATNDD